MPKTGQRKYVCRDCGASVYMRRRETLRACKRHCTSCGSTFLVEYSAAAKAEMYEGHDAFKVYKRKIGSGHA